MSVEEQVEIGSLDVAMIAEMFAEPSYLSEVARRMIELNLPLGFERGELEQVEGVSNTWGGLSVQKATSFVSLGLTILSSEEGVDRFEIVEQGYDGESSTGSGNSQSVGSVHRSVTGESNQGREWEAYTVVKNTMGPTVGGALDSEGYQELGSDMRDMVNPSVSLDEKTDVARKLSRIGNDVSKNVEAVLQDVLSRQFRRYDAVEFPGYNDPGVDFAVADEDRREYGLIVEISSRWVNPIGLPYINSKLERAVAKEERADEQDRAWDVLILAPRFTDEALERYENGDPTTGHANPESGMVHLHRLPPKNVDVYIPSETKPNLVGQTGRGGGGNPILVPDPDGIRERASSSGLVGSRYPVVRNDFGEFQELLDGVFREWQSVTESRFRNQIREAIEPLLPNFMRPYRIEQFLLDMYWDRGLNQSEIGRLVDRSGSTVGRWMREFGVMRRGTGAPNLTEKTKEIWRRMYEGEDPFPREFSGFRVQAEYSRHPLWDLDDWGEWWNDTTESQRQETASLQNNFRSEYDFTVMIGATQPLQPSYTFILSTLRDMGVDIRPPDEAPRVPYNAYPSRDALEYMLNRNQNTIVDVSEENESNS